MESGRMCIVRSNADLDLIDTVIQDGLAHGFEYYILSLKHRECPENPVEFANLINNHHEYKKTIFISNNMIQNMRIMEEEFHGDPIVTTIEESFFWKCPTCHVAFSNM